MRMLSSLMLTMVLPVMVANMLFGIAGAIWLAVGANWKPLGFGLVAVFFGHWILAIPIMLGLIFGGPGLVAMKSGWSRLGWLLAGLSSFYIACLIVGWASMMLVFFWHKSTGLNPVPFMLLSYAAATSPWTYMVQKEGASEGGHDCAANFAFFLCAGYIVALAALLFGASLQVSIGVIAIGMFVAWLITMAASYAAKETLTEL